MTAYFKKDPPLVTLRDFLSLHKSIQYIKNIQNIKNPANKVSFGLVFFVVFLCHLPSLDTENEAVNDNYKSYD